MGTGCIGRHTRIATTAPLPCTQSLHDPLLLLLPLLLQA